MTPGRLYSGQYDMQVANLEGMKEGASTTCYNTVGNTTRKGENTTQPPITRNTPETKEEGQQ